MNEINKKKLLDRALDLKALEYGEFILASGLKSNFYFDGRLLSLDPVSSNIISNWILSHAIELNANFIGGPAVAAVPLIGSTVFASYNNKTPLKGFFIRPDKKDHGLQKQIEGNFESNSSVIVIDDTVSTGGSLINSLEILKENNCEVKIVLSILDRKLGGSEKLIQLGYKYSSIFEINSKGDFI
jgi:orotate phosphoribosyltransferase|tara:strand:+ start:17803 stop:18357 length:555 start_codon:yes stop_codon:yes gene_type:complete